MRLQYIDGLKGLGALIVYFCHFNGMLRIVNLPSFLTFWGNGEFAVVLFLMLSGFSITMSLDCNSNFVKIQQIILKRYFRFAIPIAVVTSFSYVLSLLGWYYNNEVSMITNSHFGKLFQNADLKSFILMLFFSPMGYSRLNPPLWMIKYIFLGTFLIILLFIACNNLKSGKRIAVLIFTMFLVARESVYFVAVMMGMMFYFINKEIRFNLYNKFKAIPLILLVISYIIGCLFHRRGLVVPMLDSLMLLVGSSLLLEGVYMSKVNQRFFSIFPFSLLGDLSFEIYLFHMLVICSLSCRMYLYLHDENRFYVWMIFVVTTFIIIVLSLIFKKYIVPKICKPLENAAIQFLCNTK